MEALVEQLVRRRSRVRELIEGFRESSRAPFPNWGKSAKIAVAAGFEDPAWADQIKDGPVM
jgi:hypothetical protein